MRETLAGDARLRVGINWQGNPKYRDDRYRSIPLAEFAPLAAIEGVRLLSLQQGFGIEQLSAVDFAVEDWGSKLDRDGRAFCETAAVIENLDLVITSDTAVAHLAGALGARVWLAIPFAPDWRWLLDRSDSPWYPTLRLFRQSHAGDWDGVFERIAAELAAVAGRARTLTRGDQAMAVSNRKSRRASAHRVSLAIRTFSTTSMHWPRGPTRALGNWSLGQDLPASGDRDGHGHRRLRFQAERTGSHGRALAQKTVL